MKTLEQIKSGEVKNTIAMALVAGPGEGKTYLAATFPKCVFAITCPGEEVTFLNVKELHQNITGWEHFIPNPDESAGKVVARLKKFIKEDVRPLIESGQCETFVIDNVTFLADYFWMAINQDEQHLHRTKNGEFDTRGAYGALKDQLRDFFLMHVMTLNCNIVLNVHLMLEDDETLAKKPDKSIPYNAAILGSFRDKLQGMVSYMLYLEKKAIKGKDGKEKMSYRARTNKSNGKPAKSRLQLPTLIEDVSYQKIKNVIDEIMKGK